MGWLVGQFGWERLLECPVILPTEDYFPDPFDGSQDSARALFERTCGHMGVDPSPIELAFYRPGASGRYNPRLVSPEQDWTGLYDHQQERVTIWVDTAHLDDPESLVATFAHELAHVYLLGQKRMDPNEEDLEPITDLATVYFGLGVFTANTAIRFRSYHVGAWEGWNTASQGYLSPPVWSFALALFAWLRQETKPAWLSFLNSTVRSDCRRGLEYLWRSGDADVVPVESLDGIGPLRTLVEDALIAGAKDVAHDGDDEEIDTEGEDEPEDDDEDEEQAVDEDSMLLADPGSDLFTQGILDMQAGRWEDAVGAFSAAMECDPEDSECYQQRALAYLELGRPRESLADAEKAVQLDPEDPESYFARGLALIESRQVSRAIDDLNRYLSEEDNHSSSGMHCSKAYYFRGLAHVAQGDLRQAIADFTTAICRWPNWPEPFEARAAAYEQVGSPEKAAADREEAVRRAKA